MRPKSPSPTEPVQQREPVENERLKVLSEELDEALAATFPASDPPALVTKGTISSPSRDEKKRRS